MAVEMYTSIIFPVMIILSIITLGWLIVNRNRLVFKRTAEDIIWVQTGLPPYERSLIIAVICGLVIAFMTLLFLAYFHDWEGLAGMIFIDLVLILVIAYPARRPLMAVGILALLVLPAAYIDYGPYAGYIVPQIEKVTGEGSLGTIPAMAEKSFHCVVVLMTNPMAYEKECILTDQKKGVEEAATPNAIEITRYEIVPDKEIYPYGLLELYIAFENKGGYEAKNFTITTNTSAGAKYRVCEETILNETYTNARRFVANVTKGQTIEYRIAGKVTDPWTQEDERCTYAINKKMIDASIKTNFTYDYVTESGIAFDLARSLNVTDKREVISALEAAAPMVILISSFSPISFEEKDFSTRTFPIKLKHGYEEGVMTFRGKYEFKDFYNVSGTFYERLEDFWNKKPITLQAEWVGWTETYDFCVNKSNTSQEYTDIRTNTAEECLKKYMSCNDPANPGSTIAAANETECVANGGEPVFREGEPVYKARAKKARNEGDFDELIVKPINSTTSQYIELSCGGNMSEETDSGGCICEDTNDDDLADLCKIRYTGGQTDLKLSKGDIKTLYTNLMVNATGFPTSSTANTIKITLRANATYNVAYERKIGLNVLNPHYDS